MADATASATAGSRGAAFSMVAMTDLKTDLGSRFCITDLLKTFAPKTSPGASPTSKLAAGGTYASTSLIACRRTLLPVTDASLERRCFHAAGGRPDLGNVAPPLFRAYRSCFDTVNSGSARQRAVRPAMLWTSWVSRCNAAWGQQRVQRGDQICLQQFCAACRRRGTSVRCSPSRPDCSPAAGGCVS